MPVVYLVVQSDVFDSLGHFHFHHPHHWEQDRMAGDDTTHTIKSDHPPDHECPHPHYHLTNSNTKTDSSNKNKTSNEDQHNNQQYRRNTRPGAVHCQLQLLLFTSFTNLLVTPSSGFGLRLVLPVPVLDTDRDIYRDTDTDIDRAVGRDTDRDLSLIHI